MKIIKLNHLALLFLACYSCGTNSESKKPIFGIETNANKGVLVLNDTLKLNINNLKDKLIDSIVFSLDGIKCSKTQSTNNLKLGKHTITALVYYDKTKNQTVNTSVTILSNISPKVYTFEIVNTYPHDITSYTQGLEFHNDKLYESTGQYKESKLREIDYKTGKVLKNINLEDRYFGEGLTILNDKIYQLTWREKVGFIYDLNTFKKIKDFNYHQSIEGWGLCNNGSQIFKSDGTEAIWLLNPETLEETAHLQVYTNKGKIVGINEMEWISGKIFANRYQKDGVAIIDPNTGAVTGVVDFTPLKKKVTQHEGLDVLNGIAYNPKTNTIFVTGKRWDKLFEVKLKEE